MSQFDVNSHLTRQNSSFQHTNTIETNVLVAQWQQLWIANRGLNPRRPFGVFSLLIFMSSFSPFHTISKKLIPKLGKMFRNCFL
jgi:hypothetical protein